MPKKKCLKIFPKNKKFMAHTKGSKTFEVQSCHSKGQKNEIRKMVKKRHFFEKKFRKNWYIKAYFRFDIKTLYIMTFYKTFFA